MFAAADDSDVGAAAVGDAAAGADAHAAGLAAAAWSRGPDRAGDAGSARRSGDRRIEARGALGRDDPAHQRPHHQEQHDEAEQRHDAEIGGAHDVVFGELQVAHPADRLADRHRRRLGKAQVDHLDLVAALGVEADGRAHQSRDAVDLLFRARRVGDLAFVVLGIGAVHQHRRGNTVDAAAFDHLGLGGARHLVIDDFLGLLVLVARTAAALLLGGARQFVADRDRAAIGVAARRLLFARLARAHHAAVRIELVRRLGDAVDVEIGVDLHARAAGSDHRGDDGLDLLAQPALIRDLALVGAGACRRVVVGGAVGQELAGLVDDRDPLRRHAGDRGRHQMTDGAHLLRLEPAVHLEHDGGGGLDLVA